MLHSVMFTFVYFFTEDHNENKFSAFLCYPRQYVPCFIVTNQSIGQVKKTFKKINLFLILTFLKEGDLYYTI